MSSTTLNMSLVKPSLAGDPGTWDDSLNASLDLLDVHDHSVGRGVKVTQAGLNLTADLTVAGNAAINLKAASFTAQSSYTVARSLFVSSGDNELYWRTNAGVNVKVTSGTSLNLSLVGGIAGDYAAAGASLYYDDANQTYRFLEAAPSPNSWSRVAAGDIDLYEHASGITNRVRLQSPSALAASYAVTFPAALPGSTLLQQVSATGVTTWSNTIANPATFSGAVTFNGAIDVNAASTVDATLTYSVAPTSPDYLFTTEVTFHVSGCAAALPSASAPVYTVNDTTGEAIWTYATGNRIAIPFGMLRTGDRIKKIGIRADSTSGGSGTLDMKLWQKTSTSAPSQIGSTLSHTNSTADGSHTLASPETVGATEEYHCTVRCTAGTPILYSVSITIDRPA